MMVFVVEIMEEARVKSNIDWEIWVPAIVSVITLIVNMLFYLFAQPRIADKTAIKKAFTEASVELLNYMAEIISYESFEGVPTQIRKYSLQIHLYFKNGTATGQIEILLEKVFKEIQKRKDLSSAVEIEEWNDNFRKLARELRKNLAKHCGAL